MTLFPIHLFLLRDTPVFCALVNGDGEMGDFLRLPYFLKRRNAWREEERERKVKPFVFKTGAGYINLMVFIRLLKSH